MNKETFIALMKNEGWEFKVDDYENAMSPVGSPRINMDGNNGFWRGAFPSFGTFIKDEDIEKLDEKDFDAFFRKQTKSFWFPDDWKKHFKGSEFLISIVEKEIIEREAMRYGSVYGDLKSVQAGFKTLDDSISYYEEQWKKCNEKLKLENE
jgi:hypothetical protein